MRSKVADEERELRRMESADIILSPKLDLCDISGLNRIKFNNEDFINQWLDGVMGDFDGLDLDDDLVRQQYLRDRELLKRRMLAYRQVFQREEDVARLNISYSEERCRRSILIDKYRMHTQILENKLEERLRQREKNHEKELNNNPDFYVKMCVGSVIITVLGYAGHRLMGF